MARIRRVSKTIMSKKDYNFGPQIRISEAGEHRYMPEPWRTPPQQREWRTPIQ